MATVKSKYSLQISTSAISYDLRVNDCPVFEYEIGTPLNCEFPINQWLLPGKNIIAVNLKAAPMKEFFLSGDYCRIALNETRTTDKGLVVNSLAAFGKEFKDYEEKQYMRNLSLTHPFDSSLAVPEWMWLKNPQIVDLPLSLKELTEELKKLHSLLAERNTEKLIRALDWRIRDFADAYGSDPEKEKQDTIDEFEEFFNDPGLQLREFSTEGLSLKLFGNRKLARVDNPIKESPIYYSNPEEGIDIYIPFIFCLNDEKKWVIIR